MYLFMANAVSVVLSTSCGAECKTHAEARRSGRKPTSNIWSRKLWSSMPYTRSRKSTMEALWSGQKQADMSGSDAMNWCGLVPGGEPRRRLGQVQGQILRDLDGLLHGSQQTLPSLPPQGGAKTLGTPDEQLHHHIGIFLHALTWDKHRAGR
ncbi:hypothetical protein EYF80_060590 [Liparis tanakae]|uniref:Uncharacterized protein n=1 Tax=Liparis tanakae TaxID=230148 RepID=A0A4Z2ELN3_9TELE|nr:hypothetical protein EYF80_060590 [Liparis tanakae]